MAELYNVEEEKKLLFKKEVECTHCGKKFPTLRVMNSKLRRLEPDDDLRPRFQNIDSLKYSVTSCPYCGYSAPTKSFDQLTKLKQQLIEEKVSSQFVPREIFSEETMPYETAVEQYKLAMICSIAMSDKLSDQAYMCLQLAWLLRGKLEEAEATGSMTAEEIEQERKEEQHFYRRAYDGLSQAPLKEDYPICGMDQSTFDYLLAVMSFKFGDYDMSTKYCGNIVQNRSVNAKIKDKALTLKDEIAKAKKAAEEA